MSKAINVRHGDEGNKVASPMLRNCPLFGPKSSNIWEKKVSKYSQTILPFFVPDDKTDTVFE